MTLKLQILVIVIALLAIAFTFMLIKKGKLGFKISLPWLIVFVLIIIFAAIPALMDWISDVLGIYSPVNMIFFLAVLFLMLIIYSLTVTVFVNNKKTRELVQKVAYLEEKLNLSLDEKEKKD